MTPKEQELHIARREFKVGMSYHDQGLDLAHCQGKYQQLGFCAALEMKAVKDKYLKSAYAVAEAEASSKSSEAKTETKAKIQKLTTGLGDFADEQLENVVGILEAEGWTVKKGKSAKEIKSWSIHADSKKIGNLYLHKGWWSIDGKAVDLYGGEDCFESALIDNGVEDLLEVA